MLGFSMELIQQSQVSGAGLVEKVHDLRYYIHGCRSVLVPSSVHIFPRLKDYPNYFIVSFVLPVSSFLHLLAISSHASKSDVP